MKRRRRKGSGRKRVLKEKTMKKSANIVVEKGTDQTSVGCWTRIKGSVPNGSTQRSNVRRKKMSVQ
jgi:hypothetical protein